MCAVTNSRCFIVKYNMSVNNDDENIDDKKKRRILQTIMCSRLQIMMIPNRPRLCVCVVVFEDERRKVNVKRYV